MPWASARTPSAVANCEWAAHTQSVQKSLFLGTVIQIRTNPPCKMKEDRPTQISIFIAAGVNSWSLYFSNSRPSLSFCFVFHLMSELGAQGFKSLSLTRMFAFHKKY